MRRFSDQDLMMCITMWGPSARGKVKLLTPKETSEGVNSYTKTDIYRSLSRNLFMHSHKRYLNEHIECRKELKARQKLAIYITKGNYVYAYVGLCMAM